MKAVAPAVGVRAFVDGDSTGTVAAATVTVLPGEAVITSDRGGVAVAAAVLQAMRPRANATKITNRTVSGEPRCSLDGGVVCPILRWLRG